MIDRLIFTSLVLTFILGPLGWRLWHDRLAHRGLILHADIEAALRRALGGESLVAIKVIVITALRRGQVVLSVPAGWDHLVKAAWDQVVAALPPGYDLVVRGAHRVSGAEAGVTSQNPDRRSRCHPHPTASRTPTSNTSPSGRSRKTLFCST